MYNNNVYTGVWPAGPIPLFLTIYAEVYKPERSASEGQGSWPAEPIPLFLTIYAEVYKPERSASEGQGSWGLDAQIISCLHAH